jgi:hypothetical protein
VGHVQKIKPRVEQIARELGLQYATEENEGRIYINLQGAPVGAPPPLPPQPDGYQGGYGGAGGYAGYQPAQQQQPQPQYGGGGGYQQQQGQNQQEQELEQEIARCLPKFLKQCCVIM